VVSERRALGWLAAFAVAGIVWLARPFASALLLGALLAFTLEPLYGRLVRHTGRPLLASLATVLLSAAVVGGALSGFVSLFITRAVGFAVMVREELRAGGWLNARLNGISGWLGHLGISTDSLTQRLEAEAGAIASQLGGMAGTLASDAFSALLGLFFAILTMHLVLRYWPRMVAGLITVSPLNPHYTEVLLEEFRRVGRMTMYGTVVTGLAQGALAAIGYWISGVPAPVFFGVATALASLIPAVGTMLIWIPAGIYLFATGHPTRGIIELSWCALIVIGCSDYLIRPRLVGDEAMPALVVFIALFGGVKSFGLSGLIVGPVLMALAIAVLRIYAEEGRTRHAAPQGAGGEPVRGSQVSATVTTADSAGDAGAAAL
jgi:predicted PurR-regulated permease PerM